jgi:hypothetical protein
MKPVHFKTLGVIVLVFLVIFSVRSYSHHKLVVTQSDGDEIPAAPATSVTSAELGSTAHDTSALGGYNVLMADRGNNRVIEVTPDKKIVWEYHFDLPRLGLGADDAFFTDNGKSVIVNLEEYHLIQIIDYASKQVVWSYGEGGKPGHTDGLLNTPDDAYKLPNGDVIVADIKNCRIIEITPSKQIAHQYGQTRQCGNTPGLLNKPNGDTPLKNGHILISNIVGQSLIELDQNWKPVFQMQLPVAYPSDPQLTQAGNILISDYSNPGQVVEVGKDGKIVWRFSGAPHDVKLKQPSLSIELPNGNILTNDDNNHRVIVIDKKTKEIIWQYGVTGKPGSGEGQLNVPDGVDIIKRGDASSSLGAQQNPNALTSTPLRVGAVSRHVSGFIDKQVTISGYIFSKQNGYAILSDENGGNLGLYDLPVTGFGVENLSTSPKYIFTGVLKYKGLTAVNKNDYHLELSQSPTAIH